MPKLTYFPLLIDRWIAGVQELTFEERGFYISLLVWLYDTGKPIKDSDHAARILRCDKRTSRRLLGKLRPKFRLTSAGLRHRLCDELLRNGGKLKQLDGNRFPLKPDPDPEEEEEEKKEEKTIQKEERKPTPKSRFEDWWKEYPKKVGKRPCADLWKRRQLDARADELIADCQTRIKSDVRWLDGYIPNPQTYLNQERWSDELQIDRATPGNGNGRDRHESHFERNQRKLADWYEANKDRPVDTGETGRILDFDAGPVRKTVD